MQAMTRPSLFAASLCVGLFVGTQTEAAQPYQPAQIEPWQRSAAIAMAQTASKTLRDKLYDSRSARFKDVRAVVEADDWHSLDYDVFICGDMTARNIVGAYPGWEHFVVTYDPKKNLVYFLTQTPEAEIAYAHHCTTWRDSRHLSEQGDAYVRALTSAK
jgi:hypothetical protein